jgi:hypothetical protein
MNDQPPIEAYETDIDLEPEPLIILSQEQALKHFELAEEMLCCADVLIRVIEPMAEQLERVRYVRERLSSLLGKGGRDDE